MMALTLGRWTALIGLPLALAFACGSDSSPPDENPGPDGGETPTRDPFNGDCSTANWAGVSDACWSCMCGACADTLNACNDDCIGLVNCALDEHVLVGDAAELACELRAFPAECLNDPKTSGQVNQVTAFDTCLITTHRSTDRLRVCEAECGITYTDDVCQRYPAPEGGAGN